MNVPLTLTAVLVGGCLAIVGSLIILYLRSIKHYQDKQLERGQELQTRFANCKVDCDRTFVKTEVFLRETGFTRRALENLTASVNRLEGKLTITEKLPEIVGSISREIVKEMRNGEKNG